MGKRLEIQPAWLVGLLNRWAIHDRHTELGSLGYASGSGWMRGLKSSPSSSIDPTGYAAEDFRDVEAAMQDLHDRAPLLLVAVVMYYKPWTVEAMRQEGYPFGNTTYYDRLHKAHSDLVWFMDNLRESRRQTALAIQAQP